MAYGLNAAADTLSIITNLPTIVEYTIMGRFKITTDRNDYSGFFAFGEIGGATYILETAADGTTLQIWNGTENNGSALAVGTYYHLAMSVAGTGAGQALAYLNGTLNITAAGDAGVTAERIVVGNTNSDGYPLTGNVEDVLVYNIVLTPRQIYEQSKQRKPLVTAGLIHWLPCQDLGSAGINYAGVNNLWTVGGTLTEEVGSRVPWVLSSRKKVYFSVSGPVTTPLSLSSTITPVSAIVKRVDKVLSGSVPSVSTVVKRVNKSRALSVTPVSVVFKVIKKVRASIVTPVSTIVKVISKNLNSSIPTVSTIRKVSAVLRNSSITPVSVIFRVIKKVRSSTITPVSTVSKFISRSLSNSVPITSFISKVSTRTRNSTITPVSFLVKRANKVLSGTITPVSTLLTSALKTITRNSSITPVSAIVKKVNKGLSGSVPMASTIVKQCNKVLLGVVTPVSTVAKRIFKTLLSSVPVTSAITASLIAVRSFASSITPVSTISKRVNKALSGTITPISTVTKLTFKSLSGNITPVSTLIKNYIRYIVHNALITPVSSIVTLFIAGSGYVANSMLPHFRRRRRK